MIHPGQKEKMWGEKMSRLLIAAGLATVGLAVYVYRNTRLRHWRQALSITRKAEAGEPLTEFERLIIRPAPRKINQHPVGSDERQIEDIAFELGSLFPEWTSVAKPVPIPVLLDPYVVGFTITVTTVVARLLGTDEKVAMDRRLAIWIHAAAVLAKVEPDVISKALKAIGQTWNSAEIEKGRLDGLSYIDDFSSGKPPVSQGRLIERLSEHHANEIDTALANS
jgi:hypothetical protein